MSEFKREKKLQGEEDIICKISSLSILELQYYENEISKLHKNECMILAGGHPLTKERREEGVREVIGYRKVLSLIKKERFSRLIDMFFIIEE